MNTYEVTYRLPTTGSKRFKKLVEAAHQAEAKKLFQSEVPSASILSASQVH